MLKAEYKYSLSLPTLIKLVLTTALFFTSLLYFVDIVVPGFTISVILSDIESVDDDMLALDVTMPVVVRAV